MADAKVAAPGWDQFLTLEDDALFAQCAFDRFRASGPGGQKRNVTDSAVRLRHAPSGLAVEAVGSRSQHENRARALRRLRMAIALELRVPVTLDGFRRPESLSQALRSGRAALGRRDRRFPIAVAEAFDLLEAASWRLSVAAAAAATTTAAVGRLLARDAAVLRAANRRRQAAGQRPLRA